MKLLQPALLSVCMLEMTFFVYYMITYELKTQSTISDTLFSTPGYTVTLTMALSFRLLGGMFFVERYRDKYPRWEHAGCAGIILALISWCWLVWFRDNARHFAGVAGFCLGSFLYSIAFIRLSSTSEFHLKKLHTELEVFLFLASLALVIAFVALWFGEERAIQDSTPAEGFTRTAYIVEHMGYVAHLLFYLVFFSFNSPTRTRAACGYGVLSYEDPDCNSVCKPLIQMKVLHHVHTVDTTGQV